MRRKKALLIDAKAGVQGPTVSVDKGEWVIDLLPGVSLTVNGKDGPMESGKLTIEGPARISASVWDDYLGPSIHLDVVQV